MELPGRAAGWWSGTVPSWGLSPKAAPNSSRSWGQSPLGTVPVGDSPSWSIRALAGRAAGRCQGLSPPGDCPQIRAELQPVSGTVPVGDSPSVAVPSASWPPSRLVVRDCPRRGLSPKPRRTPAGVGDSPRWGQSLGFDSALGDSPSVSGTVPVGDSPSVRPVAAPSASWSGSRLRTAEQWNNRKSTSRARAPCSCSYRRGRRP
jgi:hypothetical protein